MTMVGKILVGVIGAPHGVRGEVRIKSFTAAPVNVGCYGPLATEDGRSFAVLSVRALKDDLVVARLAGVTDRTGAQALTNTRLYLDRERLPDPAEDEFYHADLVGLAAVTPDGAAIGRVGAVENHGGGDLLAIERSGGGALLVPFTKAFVPEVDVAGGRIVVASAALAPDDADRD